MTSRWLVIAITTALLVGACSSGDGEEELRVEGTITQVTGEDEVISFIVTDAAGTNHRFVPGLGLTCGGEDLTHLRVHIVERDEIAVTWIDDAGTSIADSIVHLDG